MQGKGRCAPMEERSLADAPAVQPATWTGRFKELVSKFILDPWREEGAPAVREIAHFQSFSLCVAHLQFILSTLERARLSSSARSGY